MVQKKIGLGMLAIVLTFGMAVLGCPTTEEETPAKLPTGDAGYYGHNAGPVNVKLDTDADGRITGVEYLKNEEGWPLSYWTDEDNNTSESPGYILRLLQVNHPTTNTLPAYENEAGWSTDGVVFGPVMVTKQSFYVQPDVKAGATASLWAIASNAQEQYNKLFPGKITGAIPVQANKIYNIPNGDTTREERFIVGILADKDGNITAGYQRINLIASGRGPSIAALWTQLLADGRLVEANMAQHIGTNDITQERVDAFIEVVQFALNKAKTNR